MKDLLDERGRSANGNVLPFRHRPTPRPFDLHPSADICIGSSDVYAGAFLVEYMDTSDAERSARFASVAPSLAVEEIGFEGIRGRKGVERVLNELRS